MRLPTVNVNLFRLVYWVIAIATAQHTAWGAATTMQGAEPTSATAAILWWLQGLAFAVAIDFSMVTVATKIRTGVTEKSQSARFWYIATFLLVAISSTYFQMVYAWHHANQLHVGTGVSSEWQLRLQGLIEARIVIAPLILPLIATFYTFGGFGKGGEVQKAQPRERNFATTMQPVRNPIAEPLQIGKPAGAPALVDRLRPAIERRNDNGELLGYVCPGCNKALSVSGWSRHKRTCIDYLALEAARPVEANEFSSNGHEG